MKINRRKFTRQSSYLIGGALATGHLMACGHKTGPSSNISSQEAVDSTVDAISSAGMFFKISLAQWSFHKAFFAKEIEVLDFAAKAKSLQMDGIEYVNQFFKDKAEDMEFLGQLNTRAADADVTQLLIMVDGEGGLGDPDDNERKKAVENHFKWVHAAKTLGCHSIRVNAYGVAEREVVAAAAVDGPGGVSEYAAKEGINVIVENHGSYSSDGGWISDVIQKVGMQNCGTLPDFGNFCIRRENDQLYNGKCIDEYDRYQGVAEMMPYAKAVSAKSNDFDAQGNETNTDYMKMMQIVKDHGYRGYVGIEYEGSDLDEESGIIKTRDLLIKVGKALS